VPDTAVSEALARAHAAGEREFRELADNAPVMIWRAGPDKLCDWFNKPWLEFRGRSLSQEVGYGWAEGVHPDDRQTSVNTYERAFDARQPFSMTYRLRRHDGEYRWLLDHGVPYERGGVFAGYFGSCVDLTEQRQVEAHQRMLLSELQHRVKNNLQLIISFLSLKARRVETAEARGVLEEVIQRVRGVGAVQERLHEEAASGATVDLAEYLPELARDVLSAEGGEAAKLMVEAEPVHTSMVQAATLGLMLNELLTNAMKHAFDEDGAGVIRLEIRPREEGRGEMIVADSGPGFPEAALAPPRKGSRGTGLVDALARKAPAVLTRENRDGARVTVRFVVDPSA
jgi:PAS domain S-box-containing protein